MRLRFELFRLTRHDVNPNAAMGLMDAGKPSGTLSPSMPERKCGDCAAKMVSPVVCPSCGMLFPIPPGTDHFLLLGLPRGFDLDEARLRNVYRLIARGVHPDRFGGQSEKVRNLATSLSAALNEAVAVLGDPLRRADYLLTLAGGPSAMEERGVPGPLLTEVMVLREAIDAERESDDRISLKRIRDDLEKRREGVRTSVADLAGRLGNASATQRHELRLQLNSLKYLDNLLAQTEDSARAQTL